MPPSALVRTEPDLIPVANVCLATPVAFRALNPHGSLGRQRF